MKENDQTLVAAYDVSLFKPVLDAAGTQISAGKISNSSILAPITVGIPVPYQYTRRTDLQMIYIDDNGAVTKLKTTIRDVVRHNSIPFCKKRAPKGALFA